jgi:hypothetical protein
MVTGTKPAGMLQNLRRKSLTVGEQGIEVSPEAAFMKSARKQTVFFVNSEWGHWIPQRLLMSFTCNEGHLRYSIAAGHRVK